jgi:uncharacterized RDD family membrane protein YckC
LQCGAVLPSSIRACNFCEIASLPEPVSSAAASSPHHSRDNTPHSAGAPVSFAETDSAWRDELALRLESYRGRKKKPAANVAQSHFSFESAPRAAVVETFVAPPAKSARKNATAAALTDFVTEPEMPPALKEEFSFTIAIGRPPKKRDDDTRMIIDVSLPPEQNADPGDAAFVPPPATHHGLLPSASIEERRVAAVIDAACLLFAYGAFLALFSALGGEFTVSKLSGAVCFATFAIVYLQYFALFTIFGGTTPGMMLRGLQVVSFTGEPPTPRQMLLRSAGYVLSAGTLFLGFIWSLWDEDTLTWHDRISRTYLHSAESFVEVDAATEPSH